MVYFQLAAVCFLIVISLRLKDIGKDMKEKKGASDQAVMEAYQRGYNEGYARGLAEGASKAPDSPVKGVGSNE